MSTLIADRVKYTKSYTYLIPMLGYSQVFYGGTLLNVYIGDAALPEFTNNIFLLLSFNGRIGGTYYKLERDLTKHANFVKMYDPTKKSVMFIMSVPEKYRYDYNMFVRSKYSKMSDVYKKTLLKYHGANTSLSDVLYRTEAAFIRMERRLGCYIPREFEVSSVLDMEREIYNNTEQQLEL
jgi:hypothetical protein